MTLKKSRIWRVGSFHWLRFCLKERAKTHKFSPAPKKYFSFVIKPWHSDTLLFVQTTSCLFPPSCYIYNAIIQMSNKNRNSKNFFRASGRSSQTCERTSAVPLCLYLLSSRKLRCASSPVSPERERKNRIPTSLPPPLAK